MPEHGVLLVPVLTPNPRTPPGIAAVVGPRPPADVSRGPEVAPGPAANRGWKVGATTELVGALLAHAQELGDLDEAEQRHSRGPRVKPKTSNIALRFKNPTA